MLKQRLGRLAMLALAAVVGLAPMAALVSAGLTAGAMPGAFAADEAAAAADTAADTAAGTPTAAGGGARTYLEPGHNKYIPLPENIATYGAEIDDLFMLCLWLTGVTFVFTEGLLIFALLKYRHVQGAKSKYVHGNHKLEIVWTIVPGVILFGLAVYQVGPWRRIKMEGTDDKQAVHVQVLAKQFEWNFRYPGADNVFGTEDDVHFQKELYVPKGRKVVMEMRSTDVIHSLFLPYLRFKQDVMPGLTVGGWFQATKTTKDGRKDRNYPYFSMEKGRDTSGRNAIMFNYEIACAELCGAQHGLMRGDLYVLEPAEYDQFMAAEAERQKEYGAPPVWDASANKQASVSWYSWTARGEMPPPPPRPDHGAGAAH